MFFSLVTTPLQEIGGGGGVATPLWRSCRRLTSVQNGIDDILFITNDKYDSNSQNIYRIRLTKDCLYSDLLNTDLR